MNVQFISFSKAAFLDSWITSDGRAYMAQIDEQDPASYSRSDLSAYDGDVDTPSVNYTTRRARKPSARTTSQWQGTCIYTFEPPRWVQKRRQVDLVDSENHAYDEPRRATAVIVNARFTLVAIGTHGGAVFLTPLPSQGGPPPSPQTLSLPTGSRRETGSVRTMEWSSDGYVLAVGWENGWAVWSVGGRCLAHAVGVEDQVDEEKFLDAFMYGVKGLVRTLLSIHDHHSRLCSSGHLATLSCLLWRPRRRKVGISS